MGGIIVLEKVLAKWLMLCVGSQSELDPKTSLHPLMKGKVSRSIPALLAVPGHHRGQTFRVDHRKS